MSDSFIPICSSSIVWPGEVKGPACVVCGTAFSTFIPRDARPDSWWECPCGCIYRKQAADGTLR